MKKAFITVAIALLGLTALQTCNAAARQARAQSRERRVAARAALASQPASTPISTGRETTSFSDDGLVAQLQKIAAAQVLLTSETETAQQAVQRIQGDLSLKRSELEDLTDIFRSETYRTPATQKALIDVRGELRVLEKDIARERRTLSQKKRTLGRLAIQRADLIRRLEQMGTPIPELPDPSEGQKKKRVTSRIDRIKEVLKTPEVVACKKFGICSDKAKWAIRLAEGAAAVAAVGAAGYAGKKQLEKVPPEFSMATGPYVTDDSTTEEERYTIENIEGLPQEVENPRTIVLHRAYEFAKDSDALRSFFAEINRKVIFQNMRWGDFSLLGMLLISWAQSASREDAQNIAASIKILKNEFNVIPTEQDKIRWLYERSQIARSKRALIEEVLQSLNDVFNTPETVASSAAGAEPTSLAEELAAAGAESRMLEAEVEPYEPLSDQSEELIQPWQVAFPPSALPPASAAG